MIPVLYPAGETAFTSNGLGRLSEAIACIVEEERNGKYELQLKYPVSGEHFQEIRHSCIIFAMPFDAAPAQPFRIYYISKPIDGKITVRAEHISYQLSHIPVSPFTATACAEALQGMQTKAAEACPFSFWTDKTTAANFRVQVPSSIRSMLGGTRGSILDTYGGEYEFDRYTVKLHSSRGTDRGVTLRYGKNITDIRQEESIESTITGVYPFWKGTDASGEDVIVELDEKVLHSANAANFPYQRTVPLDLSSDFGETAPTQAELRTSAQAYMRTNNVGVPSVSIKVSFIPLWQTEEYKEAANLERVRLCDTVTVQFPALDISAAAKVVRTKFNVLTERYEEIELGDAKSNLGATLRDSIDAAGNGALQALRESSSALKKEIARNTARITGANGGSIQFLFDANGNPTALVALNTDSVDTATECLILNYAGLGGSQNGIAGPFISAITSDGHINADMITVGHLLATLIRGGVLALGGTESASSFGNGVLHVYDANDNLIGKWDRDGLKASGDLALVNGTIEGFIGPCKYPDYSQTEGTVRWLSANGFLVQRKENGITRSSHSNILGQNNEWAVDYAQGPITDYKIIATGVGSAGAETDGVVYRKRYGTGYFELDSFKYGSATDPEISLYLGDSGIAIEAPNLARILAERTTFSGGYYDDKVILQKGGAILQVTKSSSTASVPIGKIGDATIQTVSSSSRRYKHSIRPIESPALDPHRLLELPVVQFEWNDGHSLQYEDMKGQTVPGIIAEDVEEIYPAATIHDEKGQVESWDERRLIPGMLALIQEQKKKISELERKISGLEKKSAN